MDKLIPVINRLHDVLTAVGSDMIDLPSVVVVGAQSSGKSSVLESLVGRDFLPRNAGICTRRPLVLQLTHREEREGDEFSEWGEFLHQPGRRYSDFTEIRAEIEAETDRGAGDNKGISPESINLRIFSPNVVDLTLVDLPGLTKVPVGDQPADIGQQIEKMVYQFIEKPNALILAVTAANTDIANSDALQAARRVDPDGNRTLGVLTKLDLMDRGTNALDVLNGHVFRLKLGFIGVVNRSQQDIMDDKTIESARAAEADFVESHPQYRTIAHRMGTQYLGKTLNKLLMEHIKACLPVLRKHIHAMAKRERDELKALGTPVENPQEMGSVVLEIITQFSQDYKNAIEGNTEAISTTELRGGARVSYIFFQLFSQTIEAVDPTANLTLDDIRTVIRNASGTRGELFIPEAAYELLIKRAIVRLKDDSMQCVTVVYEELLKILNTYQSRGLQRFPALREHLHQAVTETLQACLQPTYKMVAKLINIELAYINTRHPDFVRVLPTAEAHFDAGGRGGSTSQQGGAEGESIGVGGFMAPKAKRGQGSTSLVMEPPDRLQNLAPPDEREQMECDLIRTLLQAYFEIVKKNIQDGVPKAIMHFLVNNSVAHLQSSLVKALYKEELFEELVGEPEEVVMRRRTAAEQLRILQKAESILAELNDYSTSSLAARRLNKAGSLFGDDDDDDDYANYGASTSGV